MKNILILTDFRGRFQSKQYAKSYRDGMDTDILVRYFKESGYETTVKSFHEIDPVQIAAQKPWVLYTSSEDPHGLYKSFIEDIIYFLSKSGVPLTPDYEYLRAHENKFYMELLRGKSNFAPIQTIQSRYYGNLEEVCLAAQGIQYPVVVKSSYGAKSTGVSLARSEEELIRFCKKISYSPNWKHDFRELIRTLKYKGYQKESFHRVKFITQNLIQGLSNDWKVLVYDKNYYALYRGNRKNDFRASGSGKFVFRKDLPVGMLEYARSVFEFFNVPHISMDIGFDGTTYHLIEFQFICFGTTTLEKSPFFFLREGDQFVLKEEKSDLEKVYTNSVIAHITRNDLV